ncbi:MAG: hypothetical protein DCF22_02785 [Leptolyngbya sp.]|nr:MAG: hypothetical protein DCF22_02785 [Leptolyngbya sp.]
MQRLIGSALLTLVVATLIAPSAHAVRPELLPAPQLNQTVERVQTIQPQPKATPISMQDEKMKAEEKAECDNPSPAYFDQLYQDQHGL